MQCQRSTLRLFLLSTVPLAVCAGSAFLVHSPARAADECGTGPAVSCTAPAYADGISYDVSDGLALTIGNSMVSKTGGVSISVVTQTGDARIDSGATILASSASGASVIGILGTSVAGSVMITSNGAITVSALEWNSDAYGIAASSDGGSVVISSSGAITVFVAEGSAHGIDAESYGGSVAITSSSAITVVAADGPAYGIDAWSDDGNVAITSSGAITVSAADGSALGIDAGSDGGNVAIASSGTITVSAADGPAFGIAAESIGGSIAITSTGAITVSAADGAAGGIAARSDEESVVIVSSDAISVFAADGLALGISAGSGGENVAISSSGAISVSASGSEEGNEAYGIDGRASGSVTITSTGTISVSASGPAWDNEAYGIAAGSDGGGVEVISNGAISVSASASEWNNEAYGIVAESYGGNVAITSNGAITVSAADGSARGIEADAEGGDVAITSSGAITVSVADGVAGGIDAWSDDGNIAITSNGAISVSASGSEEGNEAYGIDGHAGGNVAITSSGAITITGEYGVGIRADSAAAAPGDANGVRIEVNNDITVDRDTGTGILANSNGAIDILVGATSTLRGATGIEVFGGEDPVSVMQHGTLDTTHYGLRMMSGGDVTIVSSGAISTSAPGSTGIDVWTVAGDVNLTVMPGGRVMGGAQGLLVTSVFGDRTIDNRGTIGALSDVAIVAPMWSGPIDVASPSDATAVEEMIVEEVGALTLRNTGTLTGVMALGLGGGPELDGPVVMLDADRATGPGAAPPPPPPVSRITVDNGGLYDLRSFVDTDGDGARDTKRVAVSLFGQPSGLPFFGVATASVFNNLASGTLRLAAVNGATTVDTTRQYLPGGLTVHDTAQDGIVQGQLLNLNRFDNAGTIDLRGSAPGNVLVISGGGVAGANGGGTFVSNGGELHLNMVLNEGGAASRSDVLVVDNAQTGPGGATRVNIHAANGPGTLTQGDGILVVDVLGTSSMDAFVLARPMVAGAYDYSLYRGDMGATNESFYLRLPAVLSPAGPPPGLRVEDVVRPEVSLYAAMPTLALGYGSMLLDTLHERSGNAPTLRESATGGTYAGGAWGRIIGQSGRRDGGGLGSDGPNQDFDMYAFQVGLDVFRRVNEAGGRDYAGLYGAVGRATSNVDHLGFGRAGRNEMDGYTAGAYWTHYGASGWYVDAVGQITWYDVDADPRRAVRGLSTNGTGYAASLEAGYPIRLGGVTVEPQVQLVYQTISFDDTADQGARVSYDDADSLAARAGVRVSRTWQTAGQRQITAWVRPSVWQEFQGETRTRISTLDGSSPLRFGSNLEGTTGEVTAGVSAELGQNWMLYASVGYRGTFAEDNSAFSAKGGLRFTW